MMESNNMTKYFNTESYYKILLLQIIFTIPALIIFIQFITSKLILGIYAYFFIFYRNTKRNNWIILLHPHLILQEKKYYCYTNKHNYMRLQYIFHSKI